MHSSRGILQNPHKFSFSQVAEKSKLWKRPFKILMNIIGLHLFVNLQARKCQPYPPNQVPSPELEKSLIIKREKKIRGVNDLEKALVLVLVGTAMVIDDAVVTPAMLLERSICMQYATSMSVPCFKNSYKHDTFCLLCFFVSDII